MCRKEIRGFINSHRDEMVEDICTLCQINSGGMPYVEGKSYGEGPFQALQAALSMAGGYGFIIRSYDNYVGTADLDDEGRQLDIPAHLDVVSAGEGWTETKSFEPVARDGKPFGRGTADDKGPAVVTLHAMRAVKELDVPLNRSVRLILGTDEEYGSSDIVDYYDKEDETPITFSPNAELLVISIEKDRLKGHLHVSFQASEAVSRLVKAKVGMEANVVLDRVRAVVEGVDLRTLGATAEVVEKEVGTSFVLEEDLPVMTATAQRGGTHASAPQEGKNALTGLLVYLTRLPLAECPQMNMIKNLLKLSPHGDTCRKAAGISMEDQLSGNLTLVFSTLTAEADDPEGIFDGRYPICATEESMLGVIKQAVADRGLALENDFTILPHHVDGNSHFAETPLSVYEGYIGLGGSCRATGGGTHAYSLKNGVAYGAVLSGTDNRMHGADESAVVGELILSVKIFAQVIVELCS